MPNQPSRFKYERNIDLAALVVVFISLLKTESESTVYCSLQ